MGELDEPFVDEDMEPDPELNRWTNAPIHVATMMSYLKTTGHRLGLIINFNVRLLKNGIRRIAL